jgi:hypothetical protein
MTREPYYPDDYGRQSIQNTAWQASTPKLTVGHSPLSEEALRASRSECARRNLMIPENVAWWNRSWREIAKGLSG